MLLRRQSWVIIGILRKVEGIVKIAQPRQTISWRGGRAGGFAKRHIVIEGRRRGIETMVDACQRGEAEAALDELQEVVMLEEMPREVAAFGPGGGYKGGHAHSRTIRIQLRRCHVVEIATPL